jgi:hypothetical protein
MAGRFLLACGWFERGAIGFIGVGDDAHQAAAGKFFLEKLALGQDFEFCREMPHGRPQ